MRIALFGGSFDPPHLGHLAIARAARQALQLDQILFVPVGLQPLKSSGHSASFEDRTAMTRLAIHDDPAFELSLIDAPTNTVTPNYTVDTLIRLGQTLPADTTLFLLLGADSFRTLPQWHRAAELPFLATIIVATRPGQSLDTSDLANSLPPSITLMKPAQPTSNPIHYRLRNTSEEEADLYILPGLNYDISATDLRRQIHQHSNTEPPLLAARVLAYIHHHHLYE
jgi:nicotinate-nucleotide adenylyltransferase